MRTCGRVVSFYACGDVCACVGEQHSGEKKERHCVGRWDDHVACDSVLKPSHTKGKESSSGNTSHYIQTETDKYTACVFIGEISNGDLDKCSVYVFAPNFLLNTLINPDCPMHEYSQPLREHTPAYTQVKQNNKILHAISWSTTHVPSRVPNSSCTSVFYLLFSSWLHHREEL